MDRGLNWNDFKVLLAIEREGSARGAGTALNCSHSTVLRRLEHLEHSLGVGLFERASRRFELTLTGVEVVSRVQQIEAEILDVQRVETGAKERLSGVVRLTVQQHIGEHLIVPALAKFRKTQPNIEIQMFPVLDSLEFTQLNADIAICFTWLPEDHWKALRLPPFSDAVFASREYIQTHCCKRDKRSEPSWIELENSTDFRQRISKSIYAENPTAWRFPTLRLQVVAAEQGLGMALLPNFIGESSILLERVPGSPLSKGTPGWILIDPSRQKVGRVRVLAKFLFDHMVSIREQLGGKSM